MAITNFTGEFYFLDNTSPLPGELVVPEDVVPGRQAVSSVEQGYYASRFPQEAGRIAILGAEDGLVAKALAPKLAAQGEPFLKADLLARREIMYYWVLAKFVAFPELAERLLATGNQQIIEVGHDAVWGQSPGPTRRNGVQGGLGTNYAGETLMEVRTDLREGLYDRVRDDEAQRRLLVDDLIRKAFEAGKVAYAAEA